MFFDLGPYIGVGAWVLGFTLKGFMVSGLGVTCALEAQPPPRAYEECANNHFNYSVLRGLRANQSVSPASLHNCKYEVLVQHGTNFLVSCKIGPVPSIYLESKRWTF